MILASENAKIVMAHNNKLKGDKNTTNKPYTEIEK